MLNILKINAFQTSKRYTEIKIKHRTYFNEITHLYEKNLNFNKIQSN